MDDCILNFKNTVEIDLNSHLINLKKEYNGLVDVFTIQNPFEDLKSDSIPV